MPLGPEVSVVIPLYNEAENVPLLLAELAEKLQGLDCEIILVDDGSTDGTVARVKELAPAGVRLLVLSRNYGQTSAMAAGIADAQGTYVVTLDGDLQNDPADVPAMLAHLKEGEYDVVAGIRARRQDGMLLRKLPSRLANALIRRLTRVYLHDYGCTLKVFRREVAQSLGLYGELHRFIPVLAAMQGARLTEVPVRHHPRRHGKSKYGLGRTGKVISDLLVMVFMQRYLQRPMHLLGPPGLLGLLSGAIILMYLLIEKLLGHDIGGRPLLLLGVVLALGGLQFLTLGVMAEMQMRTYFEARGRPPYRIREVYHGK